MTTRGVLLFSLFVLLVLCAAVPVLGNGMPELIREGNKAYHEQQYQRAADQYQQARSAAPDAPEPAFNLAATLYEMENYPGALSAFQELSAEEPQFIARSHYNQGNALARIGKASEESRPQQALQLYRRSVSAYRRALDLDPSFDAARRNIEVLKIWQERLTQSASSDGGGNSSGEPSEEGGGEPRAGDSDNNSDGDSSSEPQGGSTERPEQPETEGELEAEDDREESAQDILEEEQRRRDQDDATSDSSGGSATW